MLQLALKDSCGYCSYLVFKHGFRSLLPWENNAPFFLVTFLDPDTLEPICACPRGTLKKAVGKLEAKGWEAIAGIEYEYFQFKGRIDLHAYIYTSNSL